MNEETKNFTEEEYLKRHLQDLEKNNRVDSPRDPKVKVEVDNSTVDNLKYFSFDVKEFPCGIFYPVGSTIQIRAAEVKEIQSYSMVDDANYYDIVEKMNEMLSACVRIKYPNGNIGSYMDLRDPDRFYLIFTIREFTFQQGNSLITKATCSCGKENDIELKRENFRIFNIPEKLKKYYDPANRCFTFETVAGDIYHLAPPTIGLQKAFTDYIVKENAEKKKPNLSFLKIIPFVLYDRTTITIEGIKAKLDEFQNKMDNMSFQFLNSAVEKLSFGIEKVSKNCSCGMEVHSDMIFPDGPSAVFVVHDAFERYIKE
jgi:hypothetical protein